MSSGNEPWKWLGLMKWSLSYVDGTSPTQASPMSPEDKAFLEKVMKEGIIDQNQQMKTILHDVSKIMSGWKDGTKQVPDEQVDQVNGLLQDLRDIVEQIDFARAFTALNGLEFLLGCVQETTTVPKSTRIVCLNTLSTICQHNGPVQEKLLGMGSLRVLSDLFFAETDDDVRARIMQTLSANVRHSEVAEKVFCRLDQAVPLMQAGLGMRQASYSATTIMTTLFFLRALVTSDTATEIRVQLFEPCLVVVIEQLVSPHVLADIREQALGIIEQLLEQRKCARVITSRREPLIAWGSQRIADLQALEGEQAHETAAVEVELWERILLLLARITPDEETKDGELEPPSDDPMTE